MRHMNFKRILKRIFEEIKATGRIAKVTSICEALNTFIAKIDIQIMNRTGYRETNKFKKRLIKKHSTMMKYIENEYKEYLNNYDFKNVKLNDIDDRYRDKIWVCWWQGLEQSPEIVKKCVDSIIKNSGNYEVILLDENNYRNFVDFPDWIEEKRKKGIISRTHYSDLLRLEILANYGGIWLDSTFYCIGNKFKEYFSLPLWSIKRPDYLHCSVACGYFANYSLGCKVENRRVYAIIRDFFVEYWKNNDEIIDYLLTDYLIVLAQKKDKNVAQLFDGIPNNNPNCDELFKVLQEPYNEKKWNEIKKDTILFKLTWKQKFLKEKDGVKTFYGKLIDGELK